MAFGFQQIIFRFIILNTTAVETAAFSSIVSKIFLSWTRGLYFRDVVFQNDNKLSPQ